MDKEIRYMENVKANSFEVDSLILDLLKMKTAPLENRHQEAQGELQQTKLDLLAAKAAMQTERVRALSMRYWDLLVELQGIEDRLRVLYTSIEEVRTRMAVDPTQANTQTNL